MINEVTQSLQTVDQQVFVPIFNKIWKMMVQDMAKSILGQGKPKQGKQAQSWKGNYSVQQAWSQASG